MTLTGPIYFTCTGNTCRSPMAQRIAQEAAYERGLPLELHSRRSDVSYPSKEGQSISPGTAATILRHYGDLSFVKEHRAQSISPEELEAAQIVITMSGSHKDGLSQHAQAYTADKRIKVYTLGELTGDADYDVPDPYGDDERLLSETYLIEQHGMTLAEAHKYLRGRSLQAKEYLQAFTPERAMDIRAEAYAPTFDDLQARINAFIAGPATTGKIPERTLVEVFLDWTGVQPPERNRFSPVTDYERGRYLSAVREIHSSIEAAIGTFDALSGAFENCVSEGILVPQAESFEQLYRSTIIPMLVLQPPLTKQWDLDGRALLAPLNDLLLNVADLAPDHIRKDPRDQAVAAALLGRALFETADSLGTPTISRALRKRLRASLTHTEA